jgi:predicted dehydrogenase
MRVIGATVINQEEERDNCRWLEEQGCAIYDDYREMLRDLKGRIELCLIPTSIHWHARMTIDALQAGANVLVEKPLAGTVQEVREIQRTEEATGRSVAVGFQEVYSPQAHALKDLLVSGRLGTLRRMKGCALVPRRHAYYQRNNWAGQLCVEDRWVLDSPVNNAVSHQLHLLLFLAGNEPLQTAVPIDVEAELYRAQPIANFDTASLRASTENGVAIIFVASHSCLEKSGPDLVIEGDLGRAVWSLPGDITIHCNDGEKEIITNPREPDRRILMMDGIVRWLHDPNAFRCTSVSAEAHTLVINGAQDCGPVRELGAPIVKDYSIDGGVQTVIDGIDHWVQVCFRDAKLFSETDCPWARSSGRIDLRNYSGYSGSGT